jgi:type III pantothenate kinase
MLLAIDTGNTNTLFAIHDGKAWVVEWRIATDAARTADEYAVWFHQLLEMQKLTFADITRCVISTVVPQSLFNMRNLARRHLEVEPIIIGEDGVEIGIGNSLPNPREVGADRLVTALGARLTYKGNLIIIDSGTATTFDVISEDGIFEGGVICPGIHCHGYAIWRILGLYRANRWPRAQNKKRRWTRLYCYRDGWCCVTF